MRAIGFAVAVALLTMAIGPTAVFALDDATSPAPGPVDRKDTQTKGRAKPSKSAKTQRKTAPPVAHNFAAEAGNRHRTIQHPKLAAPLSPTDYGMRWNASNDRARDVRTQTIMNRTPASGGKVGLKLPF